MEEERQKTERVVLEHMTEITKVRERFPEVSEKIETFRQDFRALLKKLENEIKHFPEHDRDLVAVLVVNGIHSMTDEIFLA